MFRSFELKMWGLFICAILLASAVLAYEHRYLNTKVEQGCSVVSTDMSLPMPTSTVTTEGKIVVTMKSHVREKWRCSDGSSFTRTR